MIAAPDMPSGQCVSEAGAFFGTTLIVVPARGGSKGLPRKNARSLDGLPLLGWTAEAIRRSGVSDVVTVLSTDDPGIADIGRQSGLEAPFLRPAELASDTAGAEGVALHALDWLEGERGVRARAVMWLQPTSPFRPPESLRSAVETMSKYDVSAVIGVKAVYRSLRTLFYMQDDFRLDSIDAQAAPESMRQQGRPLYTPNGALYLVSAAVLRAGKTFFPAGATGIPMDAIASIDIDDPTDWDIAEAVARSGRTWRDRKPA